ncbi:MAG: aldose 1-epimerase [Bacteroidota bacterium]
MFQIQEQHSIVEISNTNSQAVASINLEEGGRLVEVTLNDKKVISEQAYFPYSQSSASAIMFPFVNRVQDGMYSFEGETYQLLCNEIEKNNAIHGLLYTRRFKVFETHVSQAAAIITLQHRYDGSTAGFPFPFDFFVTYTITETTLNVRMKVVNKGAKAFPFTIGWHPYFVSENLYDSFIDFNCSEEYTTTDDRSITNGTTPHTLSMPFQLKNHPFDTAYKLATPEIGFRTPTYKLTITGNASQNFVQFFTPSTKNIIAIEPTVGLSNSFNNGIGLQTLGAYKAYEIAWHVEVFKV